MSTIIVLLGLAALIAVIYKLLNHKDNTPDPLDKMEADAIAAVKAVEAAVEAGKPTPPKCGCGRSPTGFCVGLHKLSDAEWAMSDKNPNRVEVAPVVVTAETPSADATPVVEATSVPVKKPRAKKAAAPKAPKAPKKTK